MLTLKRDEFDVAELCEMAEALVRQIMRIPDAYKLRALKMLTSEPGAKRQHPHTDIPTTSTQFATSIAVILHCHSTWTAHVQKDLSLLEKQLLAEGLCHEGAFQQFRAVLGTLLAFRTDVVHYGPANDSDDPRVVIYFLFTRRLVGHTGEKQSFFCSEPKAPPPAAAAAAAAPLPTKRARPPPRK